MFKLMLLVLLSVSLISAGGMPRLWVQNAQPGQTWHYTASYTDQVFYLTYLGYDRARQMCIFQLGDGDKEITYGLPVYQAMDETFNRPAGACWPAGECYQYQSCSQVDNAWFNFGSEAKRPVKE